MTLETPPQAQDDTLLVQRARSGDAQAFGSLYDRHLTPTYRYVYFHVGNRQEAEDITGTVFMRAWESLPRFRGEDCTFGSWLHRIAHNAVVDHYRSRRPLVPIEPVEGKLSLAAEGADPATDAELEDVRLAVAQLPREQRELLLLRFVDGMGHDEVARAVGKSVGACRVIQHRALKALGRLLGGRE